jgi:hypothetical protein
MEAAHRPEVERHGQLWLEIAIAAVLGLTAVATAFSAYQSGKSERETIAHYNDGIRDSALSTGVLLEAEQTLANDRALFLQYVSAAQSNKELARYYLTNLMSPQLRAAVIWWSNQDKYSSPFVEANPKYKNDDDFVLGDSLSDQSNELFAEAKKTHKTSNRYELVTVILAAALFMLGVAGVLRHYGLRLAFFAIGTLFFAGGAIQILRIAVL